MRDLRTRFLFFRSPLSNLHDYGGYGDLTAVYGCDDKKLRGFAYRNHIMVEHSQPDGQVYPATNTTVTTSTAKCSKAATTSVKNGRSTTAKTRPSLPTLTIRQLQIFGTGTQLDQRRRREPPANPLLPLRPNRYPKRDDR